MRNILCGLLFSALALGAAELTGKWSGSFDITNSNGETEADTAYMSLKQDGGEVTGTAGPNAEKQWTIQKGKLDGQKLTFEVAMEDGGRLVFDLTFDGSSIEGNVKGTGSGGEQMSAKTKLKRAT
jgi:hypothetical protein